MALGVLLYRYSDNIALRFLIAFFVLALASLLTWPESSRYDLLDISGNDRVWTYFPAYLRLWWLAVAAILAVAVGSRRRDPAFWWPLAWALVRSEEHTSELQSLMRISYAVFCLKKKNNK